jgi:hypothetical protein
MRTSAVIQQRRAVATITKAGGQIYYNWQLQPIYNAAGEADYFKVISDPDAIRAPKWLRKAIGDDYFQHVVKVHIHPDYVNEEVVAAIASLPKVDSVDLSWEQFRPTDRPNMTRDQLEELKQRIQQRSPKAFVWSPGL